MAAPQVEIAVSNMDLYPVDLPGRADWGSDFDQLDQYLDETGFANFEIHPTQKLFEESVQGWCHGFKQESRDIEPIVGSLHQTFNSGKGLVGIMGRISGLCESDESLDRMADMQRFRTPMPMVVYPEEPRGRMPWWPDEARGPIVVQPSPEVYRDFEITTGKDSNAAFLERMGGLLVDGFCPDTVHSRRKAQDGFRGPDIEDVWADQFASGKVYQMHVAADRVDMAGNDAVMADTSRQEFQAFVQSWHKGLKTEMGDMLVSAIQNWKTPEDLGRNVLRMVVEVPPLPGEFRRRKAQHIALLDSLAQLVEHAGAEPITRIR